MIKKTLSLFLLIMIILLLEHFVFSVINEANIKKNRANCGLNFKLIRDIYLEIKESGLKEGDLINELEHRIKNIKKFYQVTPQKNFDDCLFFMNPDFDSSDSIVLFCDNSIHPGHRHILLCNGDILFIKEKEFKLISFDAFFEKHKKEVRNW